MPTPFVVEFLLSNHQLIHLPAARQKGVALPPTDQQVIFMKFAKLQILILCEGFSPCVCGVSLVFLA